jgi:hypothetical protein
MYKANLPDFLRSGLGGRLMDQHLQIDRDGASILPAPPGSDRGWILSQRSPIGCRQHYSRKFAAFEVLLIADVLVTRHHRFEAVVSLSSAAASKSPFLSMSQPISREVLT